ncbi:retinal rod rhodopsin-sensitive cGMP 3',5'-cyclic phosphodiesterase subunit delta [Platysternon megacephalum]|uniref:Retinal rod rhodopsin-sensitive cGMP 3',5'-cyclic phosphodiesterase subunit delta n=1 Tax=Platysternon megacephalum TaxID=55544 RepID=A0A4D9EE35_9SAUR|nr:retinal rod rhodopsin-sensitive cGMP 3',5'-cyclic phosphodiesterase subunit delta [Platysternon megacephalum]
MASAPHKGSRRKTRAPGPTPLAASAAHHMAEPKHQPLAPSPILHEPHSSVAKPSRAVVGAGPSPLALPRVPKWPLYRLPEREGPHSCRLSSDSRAGSGAGSCVLAPEPALDERV